MHYAVKTKNLRKQYDGFTLDNINLEVGTGKIVGLIGENGAGKTTLLSLLLGQVRRDAGTIHFFGRESGLSEKEIKMQTGYVLEECCYHKKLRPGQVASILRSIYANWDVERFRSLLTKFQIDSRKKIDEMSKGMTVKLMLAAALSHHPKLLILDECTSGLDPVVRDDVMDILKDYVKNKENTVLFSTHITGDLERAADEVAFLHGGSLVLFETVKSLLSKYCIVTCAKSDAPNLGENQDIHYSLTRDDGTVTLLMDRTGRYPAKAILRENPSIDEIMAIMVKGVRQ